MIETLGALMPFILGFIAYSWATNKKNKVVADISDNVRISIRTSTLEKAHEHDELCKALDIKAEDAPALIQNILK